MADTQQASSSNTAPTAVPLTYSDKSLFDQAREHETKDEYNEAADLYSELLEKRSKEFGETSKQCAEPALCFARCLLRAAQARGDDLIAMRIAKTKPHFDNGEGNEAPKVANEGEEEAEEEEESVEQMLDTAVSVCELSKRSFSQLLQEASSESEMKLYSEKLADAHCIFGEVAGEVDNFEVALSEYKLALALVTFNAQLASSIQVSMAATHVCMGDLKEALLCYQKAIEALSSHKSKQELSIDMYKSIIVDVNERISELQEEIGATSQVSVSKLLKSQLAAPSKSGFDKPTVSNAPVNVLIPRRKNAATATTTTTTTEQDNKRKREDSDASEEPASKKPKLE